jgi:hypothetical protein
MVSMFPTTIATAAPIAILVRTMLGAGRAAPSQLP